MDGAELRRFGGIFAPKTGRGRARARAWIGGPLPSNPAKTVAVEMWPPVHVVLVAICAIAAFRWCLGRMFDRANARRAFAVAQRARVIAFFHPYCNSAGGGERVLWLAIAALGQLHAQGLDLHVIVYTGDSEDDATILRTASDRFGVSFGTERRLPIDFVRLSRRRLLEAARYPRLTMIMQSLGSMVVAVEALGRATPDIFVDSTGFAFTLVIARLLARCARAYKPSRARDSHEGSRVV